MADVTETVTETSREKYTSNREGDIKATENEKKNEMFSEFFPEYNRKNLSKNSNWVEKYVVGDSPMDKFRCERNVQKCIEENSLVRLMTSALKTVGCEVDLRRHVTCEPCTGEAMGGYDSELKQVIICHNSADSYLKVQGTLAHEFIHMFDDCRAYMDYKNIEHLACTEIRAASLLGCSFLTAVVEGKASPMNIAKTHGECVKSLALRSVLAVRNITQEEGMQVINKVFDKCYNDLEPLGRRLRRKSTDMDRAYRDRYLMGYVD